MSHWIVGISANSHDASVAFVKDGIVYFTAEEERFNRKKHSDGFPRLALLEGLQFLNLEPSAISHFAYFFSPRHELTGNFLHMLKYFPKSLGLFARQASGESDGFAKRLYRHASVGSQIRDALGLVHAPRVDFIRHHLAHAASAFYASPFERSAILTLDGRGEDETSGFFMGDGTTIETLSTIKVPHSLGHLYAAITWYLGFHAFFDEWKVMGMAAYG